MQQNNKSPTSAPERDSIVGAWRVDAEGAPFVPHVALFHADGTFLIHNPDAGKGDEERPQTIIGAFEEVTADRATGQYVSRLRVTLTLTMEGANAFSGPAEATYYRPDGTRENDQPYPATLTGTRILP